MPDPQQDFLDAMQSHNLEPGQIFADDKYHRFDTDKKGDKAGWYIFSSDHRCGTYGDWRNGLKVTWRPNSYNKWSFTEIKDYELKKQAQLAKARRAKAKVQKEAADEAARIFEKAKPVSKNIPYLASKKVRTVDGLKQEGNKLLVPVRDENGKIQSLQTIFPNGNKRFFPDGKISGGYFSIKSNSNNVSYYICEGVATALTIHEATGANVLCAFNASNLKAVALMVRCERPDVEIIIAADNDHKTDVNPGLTKGKEAVDAVDGNIVYPEPIDGVTDFNDLHQMHGLEAVKKLLNTNNSSSNLKDEVGKLVELDPIDRDLKIKELSVKFNVTQATIKQQLKWLDRQVEPETSIVDEVEPYPDEVDALELLAEIQKRLNDYVILPDHTALTIALWIILTYCFPSFRILPNLAVVSPEKRCGKTTLLEVIQGMSNKALMASNISPAAMFRVIERYHPTLLIDEADTTLPGNDELRGVLNSGHTQASAYVIRVNTETLEPERFNTFCPKVLALIGMNRFPDTLVDRSLIIPLRRKHSGETTLKLDLDFADRCHEIRQKCARWVEDNADCLHTARPEIPQVSNDRAADNWTPILIIGATISDKCYQDAKAAMLDILNESDEDDSHGVKLLADIKGVFKKTELRQISSENLVIHLIGLKESPWGEFGRSGKPITQRILASILKGFNVRSKNIKVDGKVPKGYTLESFEDAFERYLSPAPPLFIRYSATKL